MRRGGLAYCRGARRRALDLVLAAPSIVLLAPILLLVALLIRILSGPPVLFRQTRVGRDGQAFVLYKFRTMRAGGAGGMPITGAGDPRVTPIGRLLRRTKLDELPQLLNVLRGEMSLVGPRPEVPRYVERYTADQRRVLEVSPGLTDPASLAFRDEEALLGSRPETERESYYVQELVPRKLTLSLAYIGEASAAGDLHLILRTGLALLGLGRR
jgi:lipopolysaccharide/colanic/teichoic acid biosynthesis glycosyltransferase